jgi:rhodanese-related sulfurtransferase
MKRVFIILAVVVLLLIGGYAVSVVYGPPAPAAEETSDVDDETPEVAGHTKIDPAEAKRTIDDKTARLIDVRTQEEFDEEHIEGATLVPLDHIETIQAYDSIHFDTTIIVYCRSGVRSAEAANALVAMGYTNVYDLGGIIDWPYEVVAKTTP